MRIDLLIAVIRCSLRAWYRTQKQRLSLLCHTFSTSHDALPAMHTAQTRDYNYGNSVTLKSEPWLYTECMVQKAISWFLPPARRTIVQSLIISLTPLLFVAQRPSTYSQGKWGNFGDRGGVGKCSVVEHKSGKMRKDRGKVTIETRQRSFERYHMQQ